MASRPPPPSPAPPRVLRGRSLDPLLAGDPCKWEGVGAGENLVGSLVGADDGAEGVDRRRVPLEVHLCQGEGGGCVEIAQHGAPIVSDQTRSPAGRRAAAWNRGVQGGRGWGRTISIFSSSILRAVLLMRTVNPVRIPWGSPRTPPTQSQDLCRARPPKPTCHSIASPSQVPTLQDTSGRALQ